MNGITALTLLRAQYDAKEISAIEALDEVCDIAAQARTHDSQEKSYLQDAVNTHHVFYSIAARAENAKHTLKG